MCLTKEHFLKTEELIHQIDRDEIADWLLNLGFYPEEYVLPPVFNVRNFELQDEPYNEREHRGHGRYKFDPPTNQLQTISYPDSYLTEKTFGIIHPELYHDIVFYMMDEWEQILDHLFHSDIEIYSYSFPIPVNKDDPGRIGRLRTGRIIYEYIEMAENDLISEAGYYDYVLFSDVKNFYPSIYTHSIPWALHTKEEARDDVGVYELVGSKLDRLFQNANDRRTNGIPVGPVVCDLISEILLADVDRKVSNRLNEEEIEYEAVRFKDDYRFLCKSKEDAHKIAKILQRQLQTLNLTISGSKTEIFELPNGLFRPWITQYDPFSLPAKPEISFKRIRDTFAKVLQIHEKYPDNGIISKFFNELFDGSYEIRIKNERKTLLKLIGLIYPLRKKRPKAFPTIIGIMDSIYRNPDTTNLVRARIKEDLKSLFSDSLEDIQMNQYEVAWLSYLKKSHSWGRIQGNFEDFDLLQSIKNDQQEFFTDFDDAELFTPKDEVKDTKLLEHVDVFKKHETE